MPNGFGETPKGLSSQVMNVAAVLTLAGGLIVPRYQRPYTWSDREVRQLIQDLWAAFERDVPFYFVGQIVLVQSECGRLEISDGQQRLTTLTMLFAYVRDRIPARAALYQALIMDGDKPRLIVREDNFFQGYVQAPGKMAAMAVHTETGVESKDTLCGAAQTIDYELGGINNEKLDAFMSYVARACTLNVVHAADRGCAQTVFTTLNMRGSPLSGADMLKSDLIENSGLDEEKANRAANQWQTIEDMFERSDFAHLLELTPFLLTGERMISPNDLGAFRNAVNKAGGVEKFLFEQLPGYARALRTIFTGSVDVGPASADVNRRIKLMKQVEQWDWAPAAIAFLSGHAHEHESAAIFFRALDCFTFACELGVIDNRAYERRYADAAKYCGDDRALKALGLTEVEFRKLIATLARSRKRDRQRRLLLIRMEAAMPNGQVLQMTDDVTVEHILPRGAGSAWWNARFPDPKLREELANLLGNLILITQAQNTEADIKSYPEKRKIYFHGPGAPIHQLTRDIEQIEEWTLSAIEERHEKLVSILCHDWGLGRGVQ